MPQLVLPTIPATPAVQEVPETQALGFRPSRLLYIQDKLGGVSIADFTLRPYADRDSPPQDVTISREELSLETLIGYDTDIKELFPDTQVTVAGAFDCLTKLMICIAVRRGKLQVQ